jgi:hypothetical protein
MRIGTKREEDRKTSGIEPGAKWKRMERKIEEGRETSGRA